ncbi:MAG TPA: hypothetical protein PKW38_00755, partial [Paludibacteraceae bacterium]|nr:hypothetical protein [Paludibacteraceae bacterium]
MSRVIRYISLLIIVLLSACSATKYVPENKYLLDNVRIKSDIKNFKSTELKTFLRQTPNSKMFDLISFNLGIYNLSGNNTDVWINRFLKRIGNPPIIFDSTLTERSEVELQRFFKNKGFENAQVESSVVFNKRKAKVTYNIISNNPYVINTIEYRIQDPIIKDLIEKDSSSSLIRKGNLFDVDVLDNERVRITRLLRNNGYYYFNKEYVRFLADSSLNT